MCSSAEYIENLESLLELGHKGPYVFSKDAAGATVLNLPPAAAQKSLTSELPTGPERLLQQPLSTTFMSSAGTTLLFPSVLMVGSGIRVLYPVRVLVNFVYFGLCKGYSSLLNFKEKLEKGYYRLDV